LEARDPFEIVAVIARHTGVELDLTFHF
jgi:hypothetical protein